MMIASKLKIALWILLLVEVLIVLPGSASAWRASRPRELLAKAARDGDMELVKTYLGMVSDINASVDFESTPLREAVCSGHLEIVRLLIEKGG